MRVAIRTLNSDYYCTKCITASRTVKWFFRGRPPALSRSPGTAPALDRIIQPAIGKDSNVDEPAVGKATGEILNEPLEGQ
jgi:hypothetical protein